MYRNYEMKSRRPNALSCGGFETVTRRVPLRVQIADAKRDAKRAAKK
jgi:hypothetical protein